MGGVRDGAALRRAAVGPGPGSAVPQLTAGPEREDGAAGRARRGGRWRSGGRRRRSRGCGGAGRGSEAVGLRRGAEGPRGRAGVGALRRPARCAALPGTVGRGRAHRRLLRSVRAACLPLPSERLFLQAEGFLRGPAAPLGAGRDRRGVQRRRAPCLLARPLRERCEVEEWSRVKEGRQGPLTYHRVRRGSSGDAFI